VSLPLVPQSHVQVVEAFVAADFESHRARWQSSQTDIAWARLIICRTAWGQTVSSWWRWSRASLGPQTANQVIY